MNCALRATALTSKPGLAATIIAAAVALVGCAAPTSTPVAVVRPAESDRATSLRRVVVVPFESRAGAIDITAEVESMLASVQVNGQHYFTVVERARIQQLMKELKLAESGAIREDSAAKLGRMLGAKGVYTGSITRSDVANESYQESRTRCISYEQKRDKKGNVSDGKCLKYQDFMANCTRRTANFTFLPKLIDVETSAIVFAKEAIGSASDSACQGEPGGLPDGTKLLAEARTNAVSKLRAAVAPSVETLHVRYIDGNDGIQVPAARDKHASALAFAKEGRTDRACVLWSEALLLDSKAVPVLHNLGICEEQRGNLAEALARYDQADALTNRPDAVIGESLRRVREAIGNRGRLQSQGVKSGG